MAYATSNPPKLIAGGLTANRLWFYASTDAATVVRVDGYFTDGYDLGMRAGDVMMVVDTDASPIAVQMMIVTEASTTTVDMSDGTAITATDTD